MSEDTITAVEVQDTDFGEKIVLESPFDAKDFIKVLPFNTVSDEIREYGSLGEKAISRGMGEDNVAIAAIDDYQEQDGFSVDFEAHPSWDADALGKGHGAWTIDADAWSAASDYFEFCGFETENQTNV